MKKKLAAMLLTAVLAFSLLPGTAFAWTGVGIIPGTGPAEVPTSGSCGDNVTWSYSNGVLTIEGTGPMDDYDFASSTQPWGDYRDDLRKKIHTVIIGSGVTTIGRRAFYLCTSLTNVTIPDSVTSIGSSAFYNCTSLAGVTVPASVTAIGGNAFDKTPWLESLGEFPVVNGFLLAYQGSGGNVTIPGNVTSICSYAFYQRRSVTSVIIPSSVTSIEDYAFEACSNMTSVTIPDSVTEIRKYTFFSCDSLASVTIPTSVTSIGDAAFYGCRSLTSVIIPDSVTSIDRSAFHSCDSLTSVTIPASVTSIGESAFDFCTSLTGINVASGNPAYSSVDGVLFNKNQTLLHAYPAGKNNVSYSIPASVTGIETSAFAGCKSLTSVTIPNSVTSIGYGAFSGCSSLTSVAIPGSVTSIDGSAFYSCKSLTNVTIPSSVTSIGKSAFEYCSSLTNVTIPSSVTSMGESAFEKCTSLTNVTIPGSVTAFGNSAFSGCTNLTGVTILSGVTSIGHSAFSGCTSLTDVAIPASVTTICSGAFARCTSLTSVTIPDSVTSIQVSAFDGCSGLISVTIPASVTAISSGAFARCTSLTDVYYGGSKSQWNQIPYIDYSIPKGATIHYNSAMPSTPAAPATPTFTDVPAGEWYADAVAWGVENGITQGVGNNRFAPGTDCSHIQILTMLWRAAGKPASTVKAPVNVASYYQDAANWAYAKEMIDENFDPDKSCTRADAVNYIWQAFDKPSAAASSFTDVLTSAAYAKAVDWAVETGVTAGVGNNQFNPDKVCNRGEIVTFLFRAYKG